MEKENDKIKYLKIFFGALIVADIFLWQIILFPANASDLELYFLDIGQGDSSLAILPGGIKVLIDGGPMNGRAQQQLEKILPLQDRYIDLIMVSHPQLDHFGGLIDVLKKYQVGTFIGSGRKGEIDAYKELIETLQLKNVSYIALEEGDSIKNGDSIFRVLSPDSRNILSKELIKLVKF